MKNDFTTNAGMGCAIVLGIFGLMGTGIILLVLFVEFLCL